MPSRTVMVAAADLPGYIASLPRLLMEHLTINVSGSITSGAPISLNGFYGPGRLSITMTDPDGVCDRNFNILYNRIVIYLNNFHFQDPEPGGENDRNSIFAAYGSQVVLENCSFSGSGEIKYTAIGLHEFASIYMHKANVSGCGKVTIVGPGCVICITAFLAADLHDNNIGAQVWHGGIVILESVVPDALGGVSNVKQGGMIVKGDGTLL